MAAQAAANPGSLIGTWESISRSTNGLGSTLAFGDANTLTFTLGAMVDMNYRRVGDSLFVTNATSDLPPARISIVDDTLIVTRNGKVQRETRVGEKQNGDPLVGWWTYRHYTGAAAYEEYGANGEFRLRVPIRSLQGNYTTAGNNALLHLMGDGGGDRAVKFAISGDTLQLAWDGQTNRYLKAEPLPR
jgi:hypothetical protein